PPPRARGRSRLGQVALDPPRLALLGVLALPDRGVGLDLVEQEPGPLEGLLAVRSRCRDDDARLAERDAAGAVLDRDGDETVRADRLVGQAAHRLDRHL